MECCKVGIDLKLQRIEGALLQALECFDVLAILLDCCLLLQNFVIWHGMNALDKSMEHGKINVDGTWGCHENL